MMKHVGLEHFGRSVIQNFLSLVSPPPHRIRRAYCPICHIVMKQDSNLNTHLNAQYVSVAILRAGDLQAFSYGNHCTLCACGEGFTDPSACTRHREATGHDKGITYRKVRPTITNPIKVQHRAGLALDLEMISNPSFIPPLFDESFHRKGMPKLKAQERYNAEDYVLIEQQKVPTIPSAQTTGVLFTDGALAAEYQEPAPLERPAPLQAEVQMDKLGLNIDFSYDVELPQEPQCSQIATENMYTECHRPLTTHPTSHSQPPSGGYYTPQEATYPYHPYSTMAPYMPTGTNFYPQQHPENYPVAFNGCFPAPPQSFVEPRVRPEYLEMVCPSQISSSHLVPMPLFSFNMPHQCNFFEETGFGMPAPEQFQQLYDQQPQPLLFYHPNAHFNHVYQPALAAY